MTTLDEQLLNELYRQIDASVERQMRHVLDDSIGDAPLPTSGPVRFMVDHFNRYVGTQGMPADEHAMLRMFLYAATLQLAFSRISRGEPF